MVPLILILGALILCAGFLTLTSYEADHGVRFWSAERTKLDRQIDRIDFIIKHVDFAAFLREEIQHVAQRTAHSIVHLSLQLVRMIERLLTRLVRHFRTQEAAVPPRESAREFVKTLSDFKEQLKASPPEIPDIQ